VVFLIVLMALEQMPESYLEAARVDSATRWQIIRLIQVPLAIPALLVALSLRAVDAFRIFATPFVLLGVEGMPVLTSVAYHYKMEANDAVAANAAALTLALALFAATAATLMATGERNASS
jgi:multiple sugar transport system permease protein